MSEDINGIYGGSGVTYREENCVYPGAVLRGGWRRRIPHRPHSISITKPETLEDVAQPYPREHSDALYVVQAKRIEKKCDGT